MYGHYLVVYSILLFKNLLFCNTTAYSLFFQVEFFMLCLLEVKICLGCS